LAQTRRAHGAAAHNFRGAAADGEEPEGRSSTARGPSSVPSEQKLSTIRHLPDILTYDTSSSAGFLDGRQLSDDVIDHAAVTPDVALSWKREER